MALVHMIYEKEGLQENGAGAEFELNTRFMMSVNFGSIGLHGCFGYSFDAPAWVVNLDAQLNR
jgi:hypothetical protein